MKTSELLLMYTLIKKERQRQGFPCDAIKKRIKMIDNKLMKEIIIRSNKPKGYKYV